MIKVGFTDSAESNHLATYHSGPPHDAFEAAIHSCNGFPRWY